MTGGPGLPPAAPGFNGQAMVSRVRSEPADAGTDDPFVLIIDDLKELASAEAGEQLTTLLTSLPAGVRAVLSARRDPPLRLHQLRLAGELAEIRGPQLRFTEDETRELLASAGIALPDPVVTVLHERTEGWAAGLRLAVLSLSGRPDPERFVAAGENFWAGVKGHLDAVTERAAAPGHRQVHRGAGGRRRRGLHLHHDVPHHAVAAPRPRHEWGPVHP